MARYVADLTVALEILAGVDWRDSAVVPMPLGNPNSLAVSGLRVAYFADDGIAAPDAPTVAAVLLSAQALADADLDVEDVRPPGIQEALALTRSYWHHGHMTGDQYDQVLLDWDHFRTNMLTFMERHDVILCPVSAHAALPHGITDDERFSYCLPFSLTGYPCAVVRAGSTPDGLPIGVQVVARPWREDVALAVAQVLEDALGGWQRPPL
jgi:amidase